MYKEADSLDIVENNTLQTIPYKIAAFKITQLVQTGIFKDNRERSFVLLSFESYLKSQGLQRWSKRDAPILRIAFPLIKIHHDIKPRLKLMLIATGLSVKDLADIFQVPPGQLWKRPALLRPMQTLLRWHEFMKTRNQD